VLPSTQDLGIPQLLFIIIVDELPYDDCQAIASTVDTPERGRGHVEIGCEVDGFLPHIIIINQSSSIIIIIINQSSIP